MSVPIALRHNHWMRSPFSPIAVLCLSLALCSTAPAESNPGQHKSASAANVCFLLQRISAMTDSGIIGIPAGTQLDMLGKTATGLKVKTKDGDVFEVKSNQVTQDIAQAESNKQKAEAAEAEAKAKRDAILAAQAAKKVAEQQRIQSALDTMSEFSAARPTPVSTPSAFVSGGTALDQAAKSTGVVVHKRKKPTDNDQDKR